MLFSPEVHAQAVRDRQEALRRDADRYRLAGRTRPCSPLASAFWRAVARLGAVTLEPDGCRGRRRPLGAAAR